ncbi:MAG: phosphoglycerate kinase [Candidatus Pacebacteria bacterium]|nr:phosphoglycerate kinase [Candidatus Paceibacterota bacterium]
MNSILDQKGKLKGKKILLRLCLNVPVENGKVVNDFRLLKIMPTIEFLRNEGAKILILGYIGRGKKETLKPVEEYFKQSLNLPTGKQGLRFIEDILDEKTSKLISRMKNGEVILFENLRKYDEEVGNDINFTKKIALLGDIYVNEAFSDSHREYASIVGLPRVIESYFGPLFIKEIEGLCCIENMPSPNMFVLGGDKLKTKLPFVKKFVEMTDFVFVGGSLANDFFKLKGFEVGKSLVSNEDLGLEDLLDNKKIILPIDLIVLNSEEVFIRKVNEVLKDDVILDAGPRTIQLLEEKVKQSKFILWNGPLGEYKKGFIDSTNSLIKAIADNKIESIVGGGDTVFCIDKLGLKDKFDFLSTGGGAMLEYICNKTLAGIEAIEN